jgi:CHASE3 domain sensor protein
MEYYLLFAVKYIRSFIKFLIFTVVLFLAKKIMGALYRALYKIFRLIKRKIKRAYFDRKLKKILTLMVQIQKHVNGYKY